MYELEGIERIRYFQEFETNPDMEDWVIDSLKPCMRYKAEIDINSLSIETFGYEVEDPYLEPSEFYFKAKSTFDIAVPEGSKYNNLQCLEGGYYHLKVDGDWFTLTAYNAEIKQ